MSENSMIEQILDENNTDPVTLYDEQNRAVTFDQVAVIPLNGRIYVILKPLDEVVGVAEDEALVFKIDGEGENIRYTYVLDEDKVSEVFEQYNMAYDEMIADIPVS